MCRQLVADAKIVWGAAGGGDWSVQLPLTDVRQGHGAHHAAHCRRHVVHEAPGPQGCQRAVCGLLLHAAEVLMLWLRSTVTMSQACVSSVKHGKLTYDRNFTALCLRGARGVTEWLESGWDRAQLRLVYSCDNGQVKTRALFVHTRRPDPFRLACPTEQYATPI